jgi:hypothetical protein
MKAATLELAVSIEPFEPPSMATELGDVGNLAQQEKPRLVSEHDLLLSSWLNRDLPPRDYLLGNVMCTTSRWLVWGETGVGKTLFALDLASAVASGGSFLGWEARGRPACVAYFDGELPAETFKERLQFIASRYGEDLNLYGYNRDDLHDGEMPPFNTPEGEDWLLRKIDAIHPDLVIFDSVMCLMTGTMSEEESWTPIKPLMRKLSGRRIAQVWLHHTGHDNSRGFGTKTREWEMDTVVSLTKGDETGETVALEFKKARLRTPENHHQFESRLIRCDQGGWASVGPLRSGKSNRSSEGAHVKRAILEAYDRLADGMAHQSGFDGKLVRKVSVEAIRDEVKSRGFLDTDEKGHVTSTSRSVYRKAKSDHVAAQTLIEAKGLIWRP